MHRSRGRTMGRVSGGGGGGNLNMSGGPLITEHLKDIDLELELLKRKREMIEQQQFMTPQYNQPSQRNYNQQSYSYNQNVSNQGGSNDFSHLYNDGSQQYRKPFAKKRQSDNNWQQHDSFPKRSTNMHVQGPRFSGSTPARNLKPLMTQSFQSKAPSFRPNKPFTGPRASNQHQPRREQKFTGNKITKPTKSFVPPNKIASQPQAARNKLVATAIQSVAQVETRDREALRLLPDQVPTKQMTGRLELSLGAILRDVRDLCCQTPYTELLHTIPLQKVMKQSIRERIRSAMLGKIVGTSQEIIMEYRTMFPKETDKEIVNAALDSAGVAHKKPPVVKNIVPDKEKPDMYFKENMTKLIDLHLREMFDKIHEIYNAPAENEGQKDIDFTEDIVATNLSNQNETDVAKPAEESVEPAVENEEPTKEETADGEPEKEEIANGEVTNADTANAEVAENVVKEASHEEPENKSANPNNEDDVIAKLGKVSPHEYKRMMPRLLKRHIPTIIRLLNLNKMYRIAVADLTADSRAKYLEYAKNIKPPRDADAKPVAKQPTTPTGPPQVLPYYAKVMGKPQLPKKKLMQPFLEGFHPKSIKKHRIVHNLLFIGFTDKEDFDGIIEADGTVIGRSTLSIRACTHDNTTPKKDNTSTPIKNNQQESEPEANDQLNQSQEIDSELDGQITDLLSSIRNSEEDNEENATENTEAAEQENESEEVAENETTEAAENGDAVENEEQIAEEAVAENETEELAPTNGDANGEKVDQVAELKTAATGAAPGTPTRSSARLAPATPSSIRTRRASRLQQN